MGPGRTICKFTYGKTKEQSGRPKIKPYSETSIKRTPSAGKPYSETSIKRTPSAGNAVVSA